MMSLDAIERAVRQSCAAVDVDHGSSRDGELPDRELDGLLGALSSHSPNAVSIVALRTAALACVEPQLSAVANAAVLARLGAGDPLVANGGVDSLVNDQASRYERAALECVSSALQLVRTPRPEQWRECARAFRYARVPADTSPTAVSRHWLYWVGNTVSVCRRSDVDEELSRLREVLRTARVVTSPLWIYEGSVGDSNQYFVSIVDRASRRILADVMQGTMRHVGRTMHWEISACDGVSIGRARTEDLVHRVLLSDFMNGYYEGQFDAIDYVDRNTGDRWTCPT